MASRGQDFVAQIEALMEKAVGQIVGRSIVRNQLKKRTKDVDAFSAEDCKAVIQDIGQALSLFVTKQQVETTTVELQRVLKAQFS